MTGALLLHALLALVGAPRGWSGTLALLATAFAFGLKAAYWRAIATPGPARRRRAQPGSARSARSECSTRRTPRPTIC